MSDIPEYTKVLYPIAYKTLLGGDYSKQDILDILASFETAEKANEAAIESTEDLVAGEKEIPKPAGFDLRNKRSNKSNKASDWTPADALYAAHLAVKENGAQELIVLWWEPQSDGTRYLRWRMACTKTAEMTHLLYNGLFNAIS